MATAPSGARHFLLSCYVVSLIQGETIKKIRIRHATLRGYLGQAIRLHLQRQLPDPTEPTFLGEDDDLISPLLDTVRAYEQVKDRKEMIFDSMMAHMLLLGKLASPNSLHAALVDWIILGRVTGVRRSEWCQDGPNIEMTTPTLVHEVPEPKAFLAEDFNFFDVNGNRIYTLTDKHLSSVDYVNIRWRFQKNGDNGQVIPYKRDYDRPDVCPVLAAFRIQNHSSCSRPQSTFFSPSCYLRKCIFFCFYPVQAYPSISSRQVSSNICSICLPTESKRQIPPSMDLPLSQDYSRKSTASCWYV